VALIVEVLDRHGEVRLRRLLGGGSLTIGRAYDNDVVLDDPYVDARHARIVHDESGAAVLEDLGSVNALGGPNGARATRVALQPDVEVRVGRTRLRFRDPEASLPPALRDEPVERLRIPVWLTRPGGQLVLVAVAAGVTVWDTWTDSYSASGAGAGFNAALGFAVLISLWAGLWAVAGRVAVHRGRFLSHVAMVSGVVTVGVVYGVASAWVTFLFPDNPLSSPVGEVVGAGLLAVLLAGHLRLASRMTRRRRWTTGLVAGLALLAVGWLAGLPKRKQFSDVPAFTATLKPFPDAWIPTRSLESFRRVETDLRRKVDALRAAHEVVGDRSGDEPQ
jgi:hypothetical protein